MAYKLAKLRSMSDAEVEEAYDRLALNTSEGLAFWREELGRRRDERIIASNTRIARASLVIAIVGGVSSVAAVIVAVVSLIVAGR